MAQTTDQRNRSHHQHEQRDQNVDRQERCQVEFQGRLPPMFEGLVRPVRAGPKETESSLDRRFEGSFRGGEFVDEPAEIERHDSPN